MFIDSLKRLVALSIARNPLQFKTLPPYIFCCIFIVMTQEKLCLICPSRWDSFEGFCYAWLLVPSNIQIAWNNWWASTVYLSCSYFYFRVVYLQLTPTLLISHNLIIYFLNKFFELSNARVTHTAAGISAREHATSKWEKLLHWICKVSKDQEKFIHWCFHISWHELDIFYKLHVNVWVTDSAPPSILIRSSCEGINMR